MSSTEYAELSTFIVIAQEMNFRRAAIRLGVSPSAISHTLRVLERRLGVKLLHRTTRSVALTESGRRLLRRIEPAFAEIVGAVEEAVSAADRPAGTLRLSAPRTAAHMVLTPMLGSFAQAYPDVRLEILVDDQLVDIVAAGFDAGIRLGERVQRDMVAVRVSPELRGVVVGSPAYFADHPVPMLPTDLDAHRCLNYRLPTGGSLLAWEFEREGAKHALVPTGPLVSNDTDTLLAAALAGVGLACMTEAIVAPHIEAGRLVQVLDDWCQPFLGWFLYFPRSRQMAPTLRALIDHLKVQLGE